MKSNPAVFKVECPKCFSKLEFTIQDTTRDLNRKIITCPDCGEVITVFEDEEWLVEHDYNKAFTVKTTDNEIASSPLYATTVSNPRIIWS